jgi:hypothetical protein
MSKQFKKGDKVRYVGGSGWEFLDRRKGEIFTVHDTVDTDNGTFVRIAEGMEKYPQHNQFPGCFELVTERETVKFDPLTDMLLDALLLYPPRKTFSKTVTGRFPAFENALKGKVRLIENGRLLTTEFETERDATQWLKDNECVGSFELVRVVPLSKLTVKTAIVVEAA